MAATPTGETPPTQFVRYAPELDAVSAGFEHDLESVVAAVEQYVVNSVAAEGVGRAVRFAHAKGYGVVRAEVEILDGLPPAYAQGIYATPGRHDALIRFSNGVAHLGADAVLSNALGLALKMFDVAGPTLLDDEPDTGTFDYNTINMPVFFCNTVAHYLFIQELFTDAASYFARGKAGIHQLLTEYLTGKGTLAEQDWAWDELLAFLGMAQLPPVNPLLLTYWTMGAVRHGDHVAKVRFAPVGEFADAVEHREVDLMSDADAYRRALEVEVELEQRPFEFDLQVQLCTDLEQMPVQDVTVEWLEALSPFVTVAKVRVPPQDISGPDNLERMDALSFTPWRVTAEHAPLGEIQRVRKEVYRRSSVTRHRLNRQERREPHSVREALGEGHGI
ncbi:MAG TPA: catalase family protein [Acidimicrobiales bacterium]|nr:catalase family protein [Acidimicrobiales bacterium]